MAPHCERQDPPLPACSDARSLAALPKERCEVACKRCGRIDGDYMVRSWDAHELGGGDGVGHATHHFAADETCLGMHEERRHFECLKLIPPIVRSEGPAGQEERVVLTNERAARA